MTDPAGDGRIRAVIENLTPSVDSGRFPAKRIAGDRVVVEADVFADGHDALAVRLQWRRESENDWHEEPMAELGNDRWRGSFVVDVPGRYVYAVTAWIDAFASWRRDLVRRNDPADVQAATEVGAALVDAAAARARGADRAALAQCAVALRRGAPDVAVRALGLDDDLAALASRYGDRRYAATSPERSLVVDGPLARFGAWYELFPRSTATEPGRHGTLRDCAARLGYIAALGFDVVYLPPIHPIGRTYRKGKNNALEAGDDDVGSPWAIGAREGGHTAVHPQLGTRADFRHLVATAREHGLAIALDIAFQCSPDHPYVTAHPEWFRRRPDGSIQYAENPPKKYQDIYPFDFECADWRGLWRELKDVLEFWIGEGVTIFRVDNPHTKSFAFWEWAIAEVKRAHPQTIFLAEAFTRPKVMHRLAKLGFTQSYTYFAWRNTKRELTDYLTELAHGPGREYLRPNLWPNTPDILTEYLQFGGRPAFMARLVLAATLGAAYGVYGPAFELAERAARTPGGEEYLDSEKYQLRNWELGRNDSLAAFIGRVNRARRDNPALHADGSLRFVAVDNEQLIAYTKTVREPENTILVVVNLDPHHAQSGWVELDLEALDVDANAPYQMHEMLTGARYLWSGRRNYVELDPARTPAHLFVLRRRVRTERDFDYFL